MDHAVTRVEPPWLATTPHAKLKSPPRGATAVNSQCERF
jgi:hypothetical protein